MSRFLEERGAALPMALMSLALLTSLMLALASMSATEPVIAANHLRASQARTLAESGLELALWALSHPGHPAGLPSPLPGTVAAAPFDGVTFVALGSVGGFTVKVANDAEGDLQRRRITAIGWTPTSSVIDARPKAHRKVAVDVVAVPRLGVQAPCALCARGALTLTGNVAVDASNRDASCGDDTKFGTFTGGATTVAGPVTRSGGAGPGARDQPAGAFDAVTLSAAALDALKTLAWRNGTYYGPGFPRGGTVSDGGLAWNGRVVFDETTPLPDGVVFVDTTDGRNVGSEAGAITTLADLRLEAGAFAQRPGGFRGWIVVNGSITVAASLSIRGLVYAVDALTYRGPGTGSIEGLAVSLNLRGPSTTTLEADAGGRLAVQFDCEHAAGAGLVPPGFVPIPGSYREDQD